MTSPNAISKLKKKRPIVALTSYDYCMTQWFEDLEIDIILVGDSLGMVSIGYQNTIPVTMDEMILHTRSVTTCKHPALVVGDMPFMSYQTSVENALTNAGRFLKEGFADAVKLEGSIELEDTFVALHKAGIPVMAHIGLNPQHVLIDGSYKVQGKGEGQAQALIDAALCLQETGIFALVLECVPKELAQEITDKLRIPTIGIGAGPFCDGQILVTQDLLGMLKGKRPKFVKTYANFSQIASTQIKNYIDDVRTGKYPDDQYSY